MISRSLLTRLGADEQQEGRQSSHCDKVFVNEKSDGCNANLIMHSASLKLIQCITESYIESGLCCGFDLDELRKRLTPSGRSMVAAAVIL